MKSVSPVGSMPGTRGIRPNAAWNGERPYCLIRLALAWKVALTASSMPSLSVTPRASMTFSSTSRKTLLCRSMRPSRW